jgi:GTP-binding protein
MPFTIAVVGRPNVGKSTLFNRLVGKRVALVDDLPGVTRDRREGEAGIGDLTFRVIDTAGLHEADSETLEGRMQAQTERAVDEADLSLFLIDARAGVTPVDEHFAALLRRKDKPVVLVANKSEGRAGEAGVLESFSLGLGEPVPISAEHGEGMADLYQAIGRAFDAWKIAAPADAATADAGDAVPDRPLRIAIVGRPNSGKSTLINTLLGQERLLTGPEAGITRDAIAVPWQLDGRPVELYDTAGLRRKAKVQDKLEKLSVADAIRAIRFADVVVLLLDATHPFEKQDLQIAELVAEEGRALVIGLNKWDLVEDRSLRGRELREQADRLLPQVKGVALVTLSGRSGEGVDSLLRAITHSYEIWNRRVPTAALNRWLRGVLEHHPPPAVSGRRIKLRYITQPKARPPSFVAFCSRPDALADSYTRYLVNELRHAFDLPGVPIRLLLRRTENPYSKR